MPGVVPDGRGPSWLTPPVQPASPPPPPMGATLGQALSGGGTLGGLPLQRPPHELQGWTAEGSDRAVAPVHDRAAGRAGAVAASNAAAEPIVARADSRPSARPPAPCGEPFQLLWHDAERMKQVTMGGPPSRSAAHDDDWIAPDRHRASTPIAATGGDDDRARAAALLGGEPTTDVSELFGVLGASVERTGEIRPTFCVTRGELALPLCDVERLGALAGALEPLGPMDKRVQDAVAFAKEVAGRKITSNDAVDAATRRLMDAHAATGRPLGDVERAMDQSLLRARAFQRRSVFGQEHVRALFSQGGRGVPVYLREEAALALPLCQRVRVVLLAEIAPSQDETEPFALCLRPAALGRVVPIRA